MGINRKAIFPIRGKNTIGLRQHIAKSAVNIHCGNSLPATTYKYIPTWHKMNIAYVTNFNREACRQKFINPLTGCEATDNSFPLCAWHISIYQNQNGGRAM